MYLVGLTGGIGSGKSTVARLLQKRGAVVIDADRIAREVVEPGTDALAEIVDRFSERVLDEEGRLDRPAVAEIVFADARARADLNAIVHPRVRDRIGERLAEVAEEGGGNRIVVLDVPLLVEGGAAHGYHDVIVVTAPEDVRVQRVVAERDMDADDVRARMASQADDEERLEVATHVIDNNGTLEDLEQCVDEVHAQLRASAESTT